MTAEFIIHLLVYSWDFFFGREYYKPQQYNTVLSACYQSNCGLVKLKTNECKNKRPGTLNQNTRKTTEVRQFMILICISVCKHSKQSQGGVAKKFTNSEIKSGSSCTNFLGKIFCISVLLLPLTFILHPPKCPFSDTVQQLS